MAPSEPQPVVSDRSRRAILIVAIGAIALETALLGLIAPLLPEIEDRTGAGDAALGLALAAYAIPIALISIPTGRLADRIGRRPLLLGGLVLTGIGSLVIAYSDSLIPLLSGRAVQGLGSTASWIAALALVSDLARPGRKGEAIGFALSANSFGAIGGPALGGIAGGALSFEAPFLLVTGVAAALFAGGLAVLPRHHVVAPSAERARHRMIESLLQPKALLPASAAVIGAFFFGIVDFTIPLDLDRSLGTTAITIGLLFAGVAVLDACTSPIAGAVSDRLGRRPVVSSGAGLLAISGGLLVLAEGFEGVAVGLAVFGIGQAILFAGAVPWLDESFGLLDRGLAYGGLNLVFAIGYTVGPLLGGWLLGSVSADAVYAVISGGGIVLLLALAVGPARLMRAGPIR